MAADGKGTDISRDVDDDFASPIRPPDPPFSDVLIKTPEVATSPPPPAAPPPTSEKKKGSFFPSGAFDEPLFEGYPEPTHKAYLFARMIAERHPISWAWRVKPTEAPATRKWHPHGDRGVEDNFTAGAYAGMTAAQAYIADAIGKTASLTWFIFDPRSTRTFASLIIALNDESSIQASVKWGSSRGSESIAAKKLAAIQLYRTLL